MDVFRIDRAGSDPSYLPTGGVIDQYKSCIWTERYSDHGEVLITSNVASAAEMKKLLPQGALITHRETKVVMEIEDHIIKLNDKGFPILETKGREVTHIFEGRHLEGKYQKKRKFRKDYSVAEAVGVLMWNGVANGSGKDVTRDGDFPMNAKDKIPNVSIANAVSFVSGTRRGHQLTEGPLYPQIKALLDKGDLGIRSVRPTGSARIMSVVTTIGDRGNITGPTTTPGVTDLVFEVYKGVDRSSSSTLPEEQKIIVRWDQGFLNSPEYLWSIQNHKTVMEIMSSVGGGDQYAEGKFGNTGFDRRVGSYDAGQPEYPDEPQNKTEANMDAWRAEKNAIDATFQNDAEDEAQRELRKARRVSIFSAQFHEDVPFKYRTHYNLGDRITIVGEYDLAEDMIVAEYVRTDDDEGDRGFPGLVVP